jgi:L,D-peptidoglycan transpeptidase YkuD (ErfK/YbiS/YcfS/YnhG family)
MTDKTGQKGREERSRVGLALARTPLARTLLARVLLARVLLARVLTGLTLLGLLASLVSAQPAAAASSRNVPPPVVKQLITVTAASYSATSATLRVFRLSGASRVLVFGPWQARVGYNGIARPGAKHEGDGRTPSGRYGFSFFFGVQAPSGFAFPFRHAFLYDVWDDDPASARYNEWVDENAASPGADPEPMHQVPAYDYAAVIAYNTARVAGRGSAIFLHVGTGSATAGCVSLPRAELIKVLRWLKPADHPRITISAK